MYGYSALSSIKSGNMPRLDVITLFKNMIKNIIAYISSVTSIFIVAGLGYYPYIHRCAVHKASRLTYRTTHQASSVRAEDLGSEAPKPSGHRHARPLAPATDQTSELPAEIEDLDLRSRSYG